MVLMYNNNLLEQDKIKNHLIIINFAIAFYPYLLKKD